jgi:hypothetical protein
LVGWLELLPPPPPAEEVWVLPERETEELL